MHGMGDAGVLKRTHAEGPYPFCASPMGLGVGRCADFAACAASVKEAATVAPSFEVCLVHATVGGLFVSAIFAKAVCRQCWCTCPTACVHNCWQTSLPCLALSSALSLSLFVCICDVYVCVRVVWEQSILTQDMCSGTHRASRAASATCCCDGAKESMHVCSIYVSCRTLCSCNLVS